MAQEYKLKTGSLDLKNGEKREVELEGIEGGKVLIVRQGNKTHAMSPNCTHYGAPLVKGVLSEDGILKCPWHGACFKVSSGDVEEAPALDALAKFTISEKNGGFYITGEEATIKSSRRIPNLKCSAQGQEKVVIVGGGSGAIGAVEGLRGDGYKGAITVISAESHPPIDRTKLSKALIADSSKIALRDEKYLAEASVDLVSDNVSSVDFSGKKVSTASGKTYPYTKLILASGGTPKQLPLPGFKDLKNIFLLRAVSDVQAILAAVGDAKGKNIVVIGSSFIGMEVGNALAKENSVSVVGMESAPLERVMGAEVGKIFQSNLEKAGVKFYLNAGVDKATPSSSNSSNVGAVHLKDGTVLDADLVVLGIGVAPATEYLKSSSLPLEKDGSIKTNESFAVEGLDNSVYAIGDIATFPYHGPGGDGALTRIEHWNVAQNAGRSAAAHIINPSPNPKKQFIPIFWSALGAQLRYCGNTPNGWDDLVLQGKPKEGSFAAYYTKGETVVAVATMSMDPIMAQSAALMRVGKMLSKSELKQGKDVLDLAIPAASL
ncbi:MAG: Mediator of RNA polymerase II transcription subunit 18 [Chaenotheca gracillima]|nr:MAG: Mediator of RNA polymerase II transcription subunit 18 [Chaenotheca gracillima]